MKVIAISLGGSILYDEHGFNVEYAKRFCGIIGRDKKTRFLIAVGGGQAARAAISRVSSAIKSKVLLDEIGIAATRENALALKNLMIEYGIDVARTIPSTLDGLKELQALHRVTVFGGLVEGVTTDTDAVLAAEVSRAKTLINIGKTAYVYDRRPGETGAKPIVRMSNGELVELAKRFDSREVKSDFVFDVVASLLAARSKIRILFVGPDIADFSAALRGRPHHGTTVQ